MLVSFMFVPLAIRSWREKRAVALGLPLLLYTGAALLLFGRGSRWFDGVLGVGGDPLSFVWFFNWWPFALGHGLNPFVTNYVWVPHGFNLTWATAVPFLALVMAPVSVLASPVFAFNLLTLTAPAVAAWTMFLLCEDVTDDWFAALIGGYLYGFSSYELGQILGHLNLDFTCLVPLILYLSIRRVRGELSGRRYVAAMTACLLAELGISTEILATLCVFGAMSWLVFFIFARRGERARLLRLAVEVVAAGFLTMLLAAPFLYHLAQGFAALPAQINDPQRFVTDPRNFLIPTAQTWLTTDHFIAIANQFDGNGSEQGAYLGLPLLLLLLLALFFITRIMRAYVAPLLAVTVLLCIFTLGPHLQIGPVPSTHALPWLLTQHVPLLDKLLPSRFTMYIALATALAAALMLGHARGMLRWVSFALAVAACISLMPDPFWLRWSPWPDAPLFAAQNLTARLGKMPNVLVLPFAGSGPGMAWQVDARMGFVQTGGYVGFIPAAEPEHPLFDDLSAGTLNPGTINALDLLCITHGVQYILLAPNTAPALRAAILAQGWPVQAAQGVTIVKLPPPADIGYYTVTGDYWSTTAARNWMGRKITITTHKSPMHLTLLGVWTRPSPALRISVTTGGTTATYPVTPDTAIPVEIPAQSQAVIEANETWVPGAPTDPRALSVIVETGVP